MKTTIILIATILSAAASAQTQDFTCPVVRSVGKDSVSRAEMYAPMALNTVWGSRGSDSSSIVFVDEEHELYVDGNKDNDLTPIGTTFVPPNSQTGEVDFQGTFKISYDYRAKECRRQIVLEKESPVEPGLWTGHTAVEICNPLIAGIFYKVKAKKFEDVYAAFGPIIQENRQKAAELQKKVDEIYESDLCDSTQPNYDSSACYEAVDAVYLEMQPYNAVANGLESLKITDELEDIVSYATDAEGYILPRFKVRLDGFYYDRTLVDYYDQQTGDAVKHSSCRMNVIHGADYAGLIKTYTWDFSYDIPYKAQGVWTYDENNQSVKTDQEYQNVIEDFNFLDSGAHFYEPIW